MTRLFAVRRGEAGQGLVEFALVLPILLVLVLSVADLGFIFGKLSTLGYASREGARTGAALALGNQADCLHPDPLALEPGDPTGVDASIVAAVQRILKTEDSGVDLAKIQSIRIFKAADDGSEAGPVNIWQPGGTWPLQDPDEPDVTLAVVSFTRAQQQWDACDRVNEGNPDSIGVTVTYIYDFVTPLPAFVSAISGGLFQLTLSETTVMALNPTV